MTRPLAQIFALMAANTLRQGGEFSAPDYLEQEYIAELEALKHERRPEIQAQSG